MCLEMDTIILLCFQHILIEPRVRSQESEDRIQEKKTKKKNNYSTGYLLITSNK